MAAQCVGAAVGSIGKVWGRDYLCTAVFLTIAAAYFFFFFFTGGVPSPFSASFSVITDCHDSLSLPTCMCCSEPPLAATVSLLSLPTIGREAAGLTCRRSRILLWCLLLGGVSSTREKPPYRSPVRRRSLTARAVTSSVPPEVLVHSTSPSMSLQQY